MKAFKIIAMRLGSDGQAGSISGDRDGSIVCGTSNKFHLNRFWSFISIPDRQNTQREYITSKGAQITQSRPVHRAGWRSGNKETCISEVISLNTGQDTGYPDWTHMWSSPKPLFKCRDSDSSRPWPLPSRCLQNSVFINDSTLVWVKETCKKITTLLPTSLLCH
jgi:hypothetical protein